MPPLPDALRVFHPHGGKLAVARGRALAELARLQHGVVALWQLLELGFTAREVERRVERGVLHRLYRGVYAVGHRRLTLRGRWMAAVLACGAGALLSHRSSAHLRGYVRRSGIPDVTTPRRVARRRGFHVYSFAALTDRDATVLDAIPCASPALTLLGLAAVAPRDLPGALAQASRRGQLDLAELDSLLVRRPRAPGSPALRRAMRTYRVEWEWTNSGLERRAIELFEAAGLRRPALNAWIDLPNDGCAVDFSWRDLRLIVEVDGWRGHGHREAFEEDRRRDALLGASGWRVLRFTWRQVVDQPRFVVTTLSAHVRG